MLSHGNVSTNVLQAEAWLGQLLHDSAGVLITAIPLYHIFALSANCLLFARLGWKNVLIINPRDLPSLIADIKRYPPNFISGVNTLFNAMLHAPGFAQIDFSNLKVTLGGGMAVQATVAERWKEATGNVLTQAWGLDRDLACRLHQSQQRAVQRLDRPADLRPPRSRSRTTPAMICRSGRSAKSACAGHR